MKTINQKLWLCCLAILFAFASKAQTTCATAVTYTYPVTSTVTSYTASDYWFKVTLGAGNYQIAVTSGNRDKKISGATVYSGTCGSLVLYSIDTIPSGSIDSSFVIPISNTVSTTYYIDLRNGGTNTTYTVATPATCNIVGDIGFCSGVSSITLAAFITNYTSGAQTYTWQPGGATTSSITVNSPTPATYTLTYHDGSGTYTTTITTFTLPTSACNCGEMTQNGAFEAYQYQNYTMSTPSTCFAPSPYSDPKFWYGPTCGTPDYYNGNFPSSTGNSIPNNSYTGNLPAHSGKGYVGFVSYASSGFDLREYIQVPLRCSLVPGQLYNISFYTAISSYEHITSNSIGAYLSVSSYTSNTANLFPATTAPQITAPNPITTYSTWTNVSGTYIGNGEQYITIGNFNSDGSTAISASGLPGGSPFIYNFIDDVSITAVTTPTITSSSCQSGSVTLTAYGAPTTTATSWSGPGSYTALGNPISVPSPTAAVTYTCTVSLPCVGCSSYTATVTVNPQTPCSATATPIPTPTVSTTYSGGTYYSSGNITVNNHINYTLENLELRMAAGTSITIASGGTLTLAGTWLHACDQCTSTSMWQGIIVQNGGTLNIQRCIIEDAVQAVYTASSSTTTPIPSYTITECLFNNNATGIYIDTHQGNLSSNQIDFSVFTCRHLQNPHASPTISVYMDDIDAATPLHPSVNNPTDLTIAGLRSKYGIYINAVNITNPINVGIGLNNLRSNLFDNLDYGIYSYGSSLTAQNNKFQNLTGNSTDGTGYGIYSDVTQPGHCSGGPCTVVGVLTVGNSNTTVTSYQADTFLNCRIGVYTNAMVQVYINNNIFNNETTATTFTTSGSYVTGQYGVYNSGFASRSASNIAYLEEMIFSNNTIQNYATGAFLDFAVLTNTVSGTSSGCSAYIYQNNITTAGTPSQYCTTGLYLQQSSHPGANSGVPPNAISITTNTITNVNSNAITVSAVNNSSPTGGFITISANTELSVAYNPTATVTTNPPTAAVYITGSYYTKVSNNPLIRCTGYTDFPLVSGTTPYIYGVYVNQSPNSRITCNAVSALGVDFDWNGTNTNSFWEENSMHYSYYGLALTSAGVFGDQGTSGQAIFDTWGKNVIGDIYYKQTYVDGTSNPSVAPTSTLNCLMQTCTGTVTPLPCANGGTHAYTSSGGSPTLITVTTSTTSPGLCTAEGGTGRMSNSGGQGTVADRSSLVALLNFTTDTLPAYNTETRWATQYVVSSAMSSIPAVSGYENARNFALVDRAIATQDYSTAQSLLGGITTNNTIESNWKVVDNITLQMVANGDSLSPANVSALQTVAIQCPLTGGNIVWRARALLNTYYGTIINYLNNCPFISSLTDEDDNTNARIENTSAVANQAAQVQTITLYPNPNNGSMMLDYTLKNDAHLEITDITGNIVGAYVLPATETTLQVQNNNLQSGMYLYRVISNNAVIKQGKIVVMK